jgi:para-nitrobenzyl esterase
MLFTSNGDDMDWGNSPFALVKTVAEFKQTAEKLYGSNAAQFLKFYPVSQDSDVPAAIHHVIHDMGMQQDARDCWHTFHRFGGKSDVFVALFDHQEPIAPGVYYPDRTDYPALPNVDIAQHGAVHNFDPAYWFGAYEAFNSLRHTRDFTDADKQMSVDMSDMLIAFAKNGNPSTAKVRLAPLSAGLQERVVLDRQIHVEKLPVKAMDWLAAHPIKDQAPACAVPD